MMEKELMNTMVDQKKQMTIESREVARMIEMEHYNLLKRIDKYMEVLIDVNFNVNEYFIESSYQDSIGRTCKCFLLTKLGCEMVANKLTGDKGIAFTAKYVKKFNEMEGQLNNPSLEELICNPELVAGLANKLIEQKKQIEVLKPKAEYTDKILDSKLLVNTTSIAKDFGMSAVTFNKLLSHFKIVYRHNNRGQWFVYQKYVDKGYAQSCTYTKELGDGTTKEVVYTKWTQAGKRFIYGLLKGNRFIPVVDWAEYPAFYAKELKNRLKELGVLR